MEILIPVLATIYAIGLVITSYATVKVVSDDYDAPVLLKGLFITIVPLLWPITLPIGWLWLRSDD